MKKAIAFLIIILMPQLILAEDVNYSTKIEGDIPLGFFKSSDFQWQCGCWYYYPFEKKDKGDLVINFEFGTDSAFLILESRKHQLGNWKSQKNGDKYLYKFNDGFYSLSILSEEIRSGKYSSEYESEVELKTKDKSIKFKAFGSCGC